MRRIFFFIMVSIIKLLLHMIKTCKIFPVEFKTFYRYLSTILNSCQLWDFLAGQGVFWATCILNIMSCTDLIHGNHAHIVRAFLRLLLARWTTQGSGQVLCHFITNPKPHNNHCPSNQEADVGTGGHVEERSWSHMQRALCGCAETDEEKWFWHTFLQSA